MASRSRKIQMWHCLRKLLLVFLLVTSLDARAVVQDSAPGTMMYCNPGEMPSNQITPLMPGGSGCVYPTAMAAAAAMAGIYNAIHADKMAYDSCEDLAPDVLRSVYSYPLNSRVRYVPGYKCNYHYYGFSNGAILTSPAYVTYFPIAISCPVPSYNSQVPYQYFNIYHSTCVRYVQAGPNLTITLAGGTEIEPSTGSSIKQLSFIATIKDKNTNQPPATPITVKVSLKVDSTSGGHEHGDYTRPRGGIATVAECSSDETCWEGQTDTNGKVAFNFNAPEAAGTHTITVSCDRCSNSDSKNVDVKVEGLKPIPPSGLYALYEADGSVIGAVKNRHESNHYLTPTASNKLLVIAINYHHRYPNDPVLHINDASLMWGGVLDFDAEAEWSEPHKEHKRGTVVDIRANLRAGAIPSENIAAFIQLAKVRGIHAKVHNQGLITQHVHVRLLNRRE